MNEPCRLILVDDHEMFLDGLQMILSAFPQFVVVGTYQSALDALAAMEKEQPDVLITDYTMPEMDGLEFTIRVKEKYPQVKILVVSMHNDRETVSNIVTVEAEGYVLKNSNKEELIRAVSVVAAGGTFYSNAVMGILLERYKKTERKQVATQKISEREREVLELIAQELTNDEIADRLFISRRTVETHRKNMMSKTKTNSIVGLLKYAVKNEIVLFQ